MSRPKSTMLFCRRCRAMRPRDQFALLPRNDRSGGLRGDTICMECRSNPVRRSFDECLPLPNPDDPSGETMLVPLTKGKFAVIDTADAALVSQHRWFAMQVDRLWYAVTTDRNGHVGVLLHRLLLPDAALIDHANGNGLDNRRCNIRPATQSQNIANRASPGSRSGFRGVAPSNPPGRWIARIKVEGKTHHLGTFDTPEEAARVYDTHAVRIFGAFARTNVDHSS